MPSTTVIPTVDLSPFLTGDGKRKAKEIINEACSQYGFFQIVNHGVPLDVMNRALELCEAFFDLPSEEKFMSSTTPGAALPAGYGKRPDHSPDKNESFYISPPGSAVNVFPKNPPEFQGMVEEIFTYLEKTGELLERVLSDCLGLPLNFLTEYNHDRSWDLMVAHRYIPATETENSGVSEHRDPNFLTIVLQDDVGGLQARHPNGEWLSLDPNPGTLVVNVGHIIQVLSNNRFKSGSHRVLRTKGRSRHSFVFFSNVQGEKWVEPLSQFTTEIGRPPHFKGFFYKDYQASKFRNKI